MSVSGSMSGNRNEEKSVKPLSDFFEGLKGISGKKVEMIRASDYKETKDNEMLIKDLLKCNTGNIVPIKKDAVLNKVFYLIQYSEVPQFNAYRLILFNDDDKLYSYLTASNVIKEKLKKTISNEEIVKLMEKGHLVYIKLLDKISKASKKHYLDIEIGVD